MPFSLFFALGSALMLISTLFVIRRREPALFTYSLIASLTSVLLLGGAILRLSGDGLSTGRWLGLLDTITAANLSASAILLVAWAVRLRRSRG